MQFAQRMLPFLKSPLFQIILFCMDKKKTMKPGAYMALVVKQEKRVYVTRCAADDYLRENQNKTTNGIFLEYPK